MVCGKMGFKLLSVFSINECSYRVACSPEVDLEKYIEIKSEKKRWTIMRETTIRVSYIAYC